MSGNDQQRRWMWCSSEKAKYGTVLNPYDRRSGILLMATTSAFEIAKTTLNYFSVSWNNAFETGEFLAGTPYAVTNQDENKCKLERIPKPKWSSRRDRRSAGVAGDDEKQLVAEACHGSITAIDQLVGFYERRLFRLAQNIIGNNEDAEEAVQTAYMKASRNLAAFRGDSRFYTWLVRITVNESLMKIRGRRHNQVSIDDFNERGNVVIPFSLRDQRPNPEERYRHEELRAILTTNINRLKPGERTVFKLCDVEGFSTQETARTLGLSLPAVKARLRRARVSLRNLLNPYFRARTVLGQPCRDRNHINNEATALTRSAAFCHK